jgi:hypothetical protein
LQLGCLLPLLAVGLCVCIVAAIFLSNQVNAQAARARVGRVDEFPPGSVTPLWLNGETISPRATGAPNVAWLVHHPDGFLALYTVGPDQAGKAPPGAWINGWPQPPLRCGIQWQPSARQFTDPCSGAIYDTYGRLISGSSPRGLDRFPLTVDGEEIYLDGRRVEPGPPADTR